MHNLSIILMSPKDYSYKADDFMYIFESRNSEPVYLKAYPCIYATDGVGYVIIEGNFVTQVKL